MSPTHKTPRFAVIIPLCIVALLSDDDWALGQSTRPTAIGWATARGGTSGGSDGSVFEVSDRDTLTRLLETADPKVIRIAETISLKRDLRVGANTSLIGVNANAASVDAALGAINE